MIPASIPAWLRGGSDLGPRTSEPSIPIADVVHLSQVDLFSEVLETIIQSKVSPTSVCMCRSLHGILLKCQFRFSRFGVGPTILLY